MLMQKSAWGLHKHTFSYKTSENEYEWVLKGSSDEMLLIAVEMVYLLIKNYFR